MDKTTHAKITINEAGETEVRQLNVVSETKPGRRHSLVNIDVSQAVERIDQESVEKLTRLREAILAIEEGERRRLWATLKDHICTGCGGNLTAGRCDACSESTLRVRG